MNPVFRNVLLPAAVLAILSVGMPIASAQYTRGGGTPGAAGNTAGRSAVAAAQTELAIAQENVSRLKEAAMRKLESDPSWVAARRAEAKAADDLDTAKENARTAAHSTEKYRSLETELAGASSSGRKAEVQASMAALEADAILTSPQVREARERKAAAESEVADRWAQYENDVLAHDPQWLEAVAARDEARTRFAAANASQASAVRYAGGGQRAGSAYGSRSSRGRGRSSGRGRY